VIAPLGVVRRKQRFRSHHKLFAEQVQSLVLDARDAHVVQLLSLKGGGIGI
jgi:hypothetical protein